MNNFPYQESVSIQIVHSLKNSESLPVTEKNMHHYYSS